VSDPPIQYPGELRWETRLLAVVTATLVAFGIATIYGASSLVRTKEGVVGGTYALTQFTGAMAGGILMIIFSRVDYRRLRPLAWPLILGSIVLLLLTDLPFTRFLAPVRNGAHRWIRLGPVSFQPSELARLAVIIWCAMLATKKGEQVRQFQKGVLPFLLVLGLTSLLILLQPNMSMAVLVALLGGIVLFTAGAKIGHFMLLWLGAVVGGLQLIQHGAGYWGERWDKFLNGAEGTSQIYQSIIGIGSGGLLGVGFGQGQQKFGFLPYAYSDFIFSAIGEEWGFLGVVVMVILFGLFCWLGFRIARTAEDPFGQYLATGLTAAVGVTAVMHMAVTLSLMPTTGLTLPFVSFGRSSLMVSLASAGILINIGRMRGKGGRRPGGGAARRLGNVGSRMER